MILSEQTIALIFRVINTVAIVAVLVYAFIKYALGSLKEQMQQKAQALADLSDHARLLEQHATQTLVQIDDDARFFSVMRERVMQWKQIVEQKNIQQANKDREHAKYVHARHVVRANYLRDGLLKKRALPDVTSRVQLQLQHVAGDAQLSRKLMDTVITFMKKELS